MRGVQGTEAGGEQPSPRAASVQRVQPGHGRATRAEGERRTALRARVRVRVTATVKV